MKNILLIYYGICLGFIILLLLAACGTTYTKPFEYPIQCKPVEIKYCEGFNTGSMKCKCINPDFEMIRNDLRLA